MEFPCGTVGLDPALLWLWCRLAPVASIQPLAWELPYATSMALKRRRGHTERQLRRVGRQEVVKAARVDQAMPWVWPKKKKNISFVKIHAYL